MVVSVVGGRIARKIARYEALHSPSPRLPVRRAFPEGGYYILGSDFETPREIRIVADAGPLGYREIAAHGHADALSFTLSVAGRELLVDPGTYAYHTQAAWRAMPSEVNSARAISATSSGLTQRAPRASARGTSSGGLPAASSSRRARSECWSAVEKPVPTLPA